MVFSVFTRKMSGKIALVFDIGSASVAGALVLFKTGETPKIIYAVQRDMIFQEELDAIRLRGIMLKTLNEVAMDVQKNGVSHLKFTQMGSRVPEVAYCTLASPWYATQTRMIRVKKDKPFDVTKQFIDDLMGAEIEAFKSSEEVRGYIGDDRASVMEKRLIQVKLNGYETSEPHGKKARSIEAALFVSVSPKELLKDIAGEIRRTYVVSEVEFSSFSLVAFDVLRNIAHHADNFLFLDISGEVTDLTLVRSGILLETVTFPIGKRDIIRKLAKILKTNPADALSILHLYHEQNISTHHEDSIKVALFSAAGEWTSSFQNALSTLSESFAIPSKVFFTSDKDLEEWFASLITKEQFAQFTMTDEKFDVTPVNAALLNDFCRFNSSAARDPFIMIETVFANKVRGL